MSGSPSLLALGTRTSAGRCTSNTTPPARHLLRLLDLALTFSRGRPPDQRGSGERPCQPKPKLRRRVVPSLWRLGAALTLLGLGWVSLARLPGVDAAFSSTNNNGSNTLSLSYWTPCNAQSISLTNTSGGTPGKAEQDDAVTFTFDQPLNPASVLTGWSGSTLSVVVRIVDSGSSDSLVVYDAANTTLANLGTVALNGDFTGGAPGTASFTASQMTQNGTSIAIVLGAPAGAVQRTESNPRAPGWTPSSGASNPGGIACSTATYTAPSAVLF